MAAAPGSEARASSVWRSWAIFCSSALRSSAWRDRSCFRRVDPLFSWEAFWAGEASSSFSGWGAGDDFFGLGMVFSPKPWPDAERDHAVGVQRARGMRGDGVKAETGEIVSDAAKAAVRATDTMVMELLMSCWKLIFSLF